MSINNRSKYALYHTESIRTKYIVCKEELGHGTYGVVKKCIHRKTRNIYAVKIIDKNAVPHLKLLQKEILIARSFSHPNVICLKDFFEDERNVFMVTPVYSGGELFHKMNQRFQRKEYFSENEIAALTKRILKSVMHCHSMGVAHRDIKPENFLFTSHDDNAELVLIDFGLSTIFNTKKYMKSCVGSSHYVAPEVLQKKYTNKCDLWSVGVILYTLLSKGVPPFRGKHNSEILSNIRNGSVKYSGKMWENVSSEAINLVCSLLNKDPKKRPSAEEALAHPFLKQNFPTEILSSRDEGLGLISMPDLVEMFGSVQEAQRVLDSYDADGNGFLEHEDFNFVISCKQ